MPDQYTIRARVLPALLVALPLGLATLAWFPDGLSGWSALWGLAVWSGATVLLGQLGKTPLRRCHVYSFFGWMPPPAAVRPKPQVCEFCGPTCPAWTRVAAPAGGTGRKRVSRRKEASSF